METNPFRPDVPSLPENLTDLHEYLRAQAHVIYEQHNKTQAGDSTFPIELASLCGPTQLYNLGSLTRFFHAEFGIIYARYVKFCGNYWTEAAHSIVGHEQNSDEWVVTNVLTRVSSTRIVGQVLCTGESIGNNYGWVQVAGPNVWPVTYSGNVPSRAQWVSFDLTNQVFSLNSNEAAGQFRRTSPFTEVLDGSDSYVPQRWTVPAGAFVFQFEDKLTTEARIAENVNTAIAPYLARITALESDLDELSSYVSPTFGATLATLTSNLTLEILARGSADSNLSSRITTLELAGYVTGSTFSALASDVTNLTNDFNVYVVGNDATIAAHETRLSALESAGVDTALADNTVADNSSFTVLTDTNLQALLQEIDSKLQSLQDQIDALP